MKDSREFWNKQAKNFDSESNKELDHYIEMTRTHLTSEQNVLDFGCGTGYSTRQLGESVKTIVGLDYSEEMIKVAELKPKQENVSYQVGSIEDMTSGQGQYDVVVVYNVLHLVDNLDDLMKQMNQLLKPDGLLISATACIGQKKSFVTQLLKLLSKLGFFIKVNTYSYQSLTDTINRHGFETIDSKELNETAPNLYLVSKKNK